MLRTLFFLLLISNTAVRGQPTFADEFKRIETDLIQLHKSIESLSANQNPNSYEVRLAALELNYISLSGKITMLEDSLDSLHPDSEVPASLKQLEQSTSEELLIRRISNFRSFVLAWYDLGEQLEAISATAESILIFPEGKKQSKILVNIGQMAGIGGSIAGSVLANQKPAQGITTIGVSLSFSGIMSQLFKNKQPRIYIENVSRNIAFTDNVHAFERIAATFSKKAGHLYHSVNDHWDAPDWRPGNKDLREFYALIILRKDLNVIVRHMKAKAEHMLKSPLTEEGRHHLNNLVFRYNKALQSWEISELVYLNTYEYLAKTMQGSFWQ